jgi:hypothetical protein
MTLPMFGASTVSKEAMKQLLAQRNPNPPLEVIDLYYELENLWGIRADVLVSQMFLETEYLKSWWSQPPRRNMAGIGVTGESSNSDPHSNAWAFKDEASCWYKGYSFADWRAAVLAHYGHMSAYCFADERNNASQIDPRYSAARSVFAAKGWPLVQVATDLNGRWAVPGTTYGQTIENVYNAALAIHNALPHQDTTTPSSHNTLLELIPLNSAPAQPTPIQILFPLAPSSSATWLQGVDGVTLSQGAGKVASDSSRVRSKPRLDAEVLRELNQGTAVQWNAYTDNGADAGNGTRWYLIDDTTGGGWIYSSLVS